MLMMGSQLMKDHHRVTLLAALRLPASGCSSLFTFRCTANKAWSASSGRTQCMKAIWLVSLSCSIGFPAGSSYCFSSPLCQSSFLRRLVLSGQGA